MKVLISNLFSYFQSLTVFDNYCVFIFQVYKKRWINGSLIIVFMRSVSSLQNTNTKKASDIIGRM